MDAALWVLNPSILLVDRLVCISWLSSIFHASVSEKIETIVTWKINETCMFNLYRVVATILMLFTATAMVVKDMCFTGAALWRYCQWFIEHFFNFIDVKSNFDTICLSLIYLLSIMMCHIYMYMNNNNYYDLCDQE